MANAERATRGRATSGKRPASRRRTSSKGGANEATVLVPVVTPHLNVYRLHVPTRGMSYVGDAGKTVASYLPPPERLAFYGGLGIAAVFGVIEWPVAAAVGVGIALAQRGRGSGGPPSGEARVQETKSESGDDKTS